MKRLLSLICALALLACAGTNAWAAANAELARIFAHDGTLYAYVDITEADTPITKATAKIGSQSFPAAGALQTVRQAGSPIYCMLLLDVSNSMPDFTGGIDAFADNLAELGGENTRFILATFGDAFKIVDENIQPDQLPQTLADMAYVDKNTRLYGGIEGALDYFAQLQRGGNEFYSVIILTDAVVYNTQGGITYEELLERIGNSDVMLHSVGFGADTESLDSLGALVSAAQGKHRVIDTDSAVAEAVTDIWGYLDSLFLAEFKLADYTPSGGAERVTITFASGAELVCKAESEVVIAATDAASPGGGTAPPTNQGHTQSGQTAQAAMPMVAPDNSRSAGVIAAGTGIAIAALAVIVLLLRRKKTPPAEAGGAGIYMRLEVLQGSFIGKRTELNLAKELFVGSDKSCAIAFSGAAISPQNSRVFTANGAVYIEDLHSPHGTFVNGMRIEMANILRSGDEISTGGAVFKLKF